jgi:hypothetical protein
MQVGFEGQGDGSSSGSVQSRALLLAALNFLFLPPDPYPT